LKFLIRLSSSPLSRTAIEVVSLSKYFEAIDLISEKLSGTHPRVRGDKITRAKAEAICGKFSYLP
jgi:hypothetical protein